MTNSRTPTTIIWARSSLTPPARGAEVVIWVVAHARDEHRQAIENIVDLVTEPGARLENEVPMYLGTEISKIVNANEVFGALSQGYSRWRDILDQSHVSSGPAMTDVLSKLIEMGLVQRRAPINDAQNKRKAGYFIVDSLSLFYYRYVFRYSPQRQLLDPDVFFDRYVG